MLVFSDKEVAEVNAKLDRIKEGVEGAIAIIHDMKQDLCYHCGMYKLAHEGACDGCRWRDV